MSVGFGRSSSLFSTTSDYECNWSQASCEGTMVCGGITCELAGWYPAANLTLLSTDYLRFPGLWCVVFQYSSGLMYWAYYAHSWRCWCGLNVSLRPLLVNSLGNDSLRGYHVCVSTWGTCEQEWHFCCERFTLRTFLSGSLSEDFLWHRQRIWYTHGRSRDRCDVHVSNICEDRRLSASLFSYHDIFLLIHRPSKTIGRTTSSIGLWHSLFIAVLLLPLFKLSFS